MYFVPKGIQLICPRNEQPKCKGKQALRDAREINAKYKSPNMFTGEAHPSPTTRFLYHAKQRKEQKENTPKLTHA